MFRLLLGDSTCLRLLEESDAVELHALIEANRAHLARWLPWAAAQTFDDTLGFIRKTREQVAANDGFQTAIVLEERIAGMVGFHGVDWVKRSTGIGYWLAAGRQGRGTMTEAVRVLTDHALSVWDLHRVEIRAAAENRGSRAIPERLGFREEGTLREAESVDGRWLDVVVYAVLASEWSR
ncbi:MAG TPA: GNAT family protein [Solirubrobacterales bacterium]